MSKHKLQESIGGPFPLGDAWLMDGSVHDRAFAECICDSHEPCPRCGGQMHSEAVYGPSFIYVCADCGFDDP